MVKSWCCYLSLVCGCFNSSEENDSQFWIHLPHIFGVKIKDVWSFTTQIKNDSSKIKNEIFHWYHVPPLEDGSVPKHGEIISSIKGWFQIKPLETRFNWCFVFQSRKNRDKFDSGPAGSVSFQKCSFVDLWGVDLLTSCFAVVSLRNINTGSLLPWGSCCVSFQNFPRPCVNDVCFECSCYPHVVRSSNGWILAMSKYGTSFTIVAEIRVIAAWIHHRKNTQKQSPPFQGLLSEWQDRPHIWRSDIPQPWWDGKTAKKCQQDTHAP